MAISVTTIATSIAALSVSGVTIKDLTQIPEAVYPRDCPILFPQPEPFMSDLRINRQSLGSGTYKKDVLYTLRYVYLHQPVDSGRGLYDIYQTMTGNVCAILDAILLNDALSGAIDITPQGVISMGLFEGPRDQRNSSDQKKEGALFWGCELLFDVTEFED
jgi:hypothetical protein